MSAAHASPPAAGHVEAFRSTGTSPGRIGRAAVSLPGRPAPVEAVYEVHGPAHAPVVVLLGGISADRHLLPTAVNPAPGWWPEVVRPGGALPSLGLRLVSLDWLDEPTGISTTDQAMAVAAVLDELGAPAADLVGASYGGMVALAFASRFPERTRRLVLLCAAHRPHPMATALRSIQRRIVELAEAGGRAGDGLALARSLAMTTYRSAEEFDARFTPWAVGGTASALSYLEARGADFAARFGATRFRVLSASVDDHRVRPASVVAPSTLVSVDSDALVPPWLVDELARELGGPAAHLRLSSVYGHDAFLKEGEAVTSILTSVLSGSAR